jgi:hypothetical protein
MKRMRGSMDRMTAWWLLAMWLVAMWLVAMWLVAMWLVAMWLLSALPASSTWLPVLRAQEETRRTGVKVDPVRVRRLQANSLPPITRPILFDTPEADRILSALEVLPADNPFHELVDEWPIFPAVVRYDELQRGEVDHAMRVTVRRSRRAYVYPATHFASKLTDDNLLRMGERLRLRASFNVNGFSPPVPAILKGLKRYGLFVADNGIEWAISVTPDPRIPSLHEELRKIKGADFEVVVAPGTRP